MAGDERLTYSAREVAQLLGVGKNTIYRAVQRGELPGFFLGKRAIIPKAAFEEMLKNIKAENVRREPLRTGTPEP